MSRTETEFHAETRWRFDGMMELIQSSRFDGRRLVRAGHCLGGAVVLAALIGCSGSGMESQASGTVRLDGRAIGPGMVVFAPVSGGRPATGSIANDGRYTLKTSRNSGLAAGKYRVAVSIREMPINVQRGDRPPPGKLLIPEKYEQSSTSGLEYDVAPGGNTIDIELASQ